jgi:hypothetical protein
VIPIACEDCRNEARFALVDEYAAWAFRCELHAGEGRIDDFRLVELPDGFGVPDPEAS